jgi:hypothetical protein
MEKDSVILPDLFYYLPIFLPLAGGLKMMIP